MIVILGASGYLGTEFVRYFQDRGIAHRGLSRSGCNYYAPAELARKLRQLSAEFLINCAGYTGKPNVDACESHRAECLMANAVLPGLIDQACEAADLAWGHVSSGCIYTGTNPEAGFTELDPPNFSFRQNNCSFYSGSKALGEEILSRASRCYIWRLRIPFDHRDSSRNYLSKVMRYDKLLDVRNSLCHVGQFVDACYQCWSRGLDFGIYNLTNSGSVTTREVAHRLKQAGLTDKQFQFFSDEAEFMKTAAIAPRSNTVLDNAKAVSLDLPLTPIEAALDEAIANWIPENATSLA